MSKNINEYSENGFDIKFEREHKIRIGVILETLLENENKIENDCIANSQTTPRQEMPNLKLHEEERLETAKVYYIISLAKSLKPRECYKSVIISKCSRPEVGNS
ncbi:hypothetical protein RF11_02996 [Thelohanellus kitauei]|uniref:Uncharacterized protein n=1 Tax=Thelohanellus kitauei TaxID=669202 RepID=A0A0C2NDQ6_THEKT|nr:hypothetical protein RF11_02996 [Thelohanellus kitauei]